jgi:glutamate N-acetyltransferase/amino-acid N-acetyltransferase
MSDSVVVPGFRWAGVEAGIRKHGGRPDLALLLADEPVACAGIFTRSDTAAAPVRLSRATVARGRARAVLMNAGCANACTGPDGDQATHRMAASLEKQGIPRDQVLVASTGVIGTVLPADRVEAQAGALVSALRPEGIESFARAIMTTDTREKVASRRGMVGGRAVTVAGVCKGAGMIMPDMATMLACIATDAAVEPAALRNLLGAAAWPSFNAVTVDGDTSTNDTLFLLASGRAGNTAIRDAESPGYAELLALVRETCVELAKKIAADGEGATKFIEVAVLEARDEHEADVIARRIANSPLVKTALHAADANWGRVMAAIGACGLGVDASRIALAIDDVVLVTNGIGLGPSAEDRAAERMKTPGFVLWVRLGRGSATRSVFTCDYSAEYVRINAEYRT